MATLKRYSTILVLAILVSVTTWARVLPPADPAPTIVEVYVENSTLTLAPSDTDTDAVTIDLNAFSHGELPRIIEVGNVGVLIFDAQDTRDSSLGKLYPLRRGVKAKAWTIAVSTTPCETLPMRTQLTLFDDDPVQVFITPEALPEAFWEWRDTQFIGYPSKDNPLKLSSKSLTLPKVKTE